MKPNLFMGLYLLVRLKIMPQKGTKSTKVFSVQRRDPLHQFAFFVPFCG